MRPDQVPDVMVDAAARAVHEHSRAGFPTDPPWDDLSAPDRDSYRDAERIALAAALSVCEVEQQWRRTWHPRVSVGLCGCGWGVDGQSHARHVLALLAESRHVAERGRP